MRYQFIFAALVSTALAYPSKRDNIWIEPSCEDRRSPCPMVNTLANHGFLPRNGLNISMSDLVTAFNDSVNLASSATQLVGAKALTTSSTSNTTFNLDDLDKHNIIEHDGSLSRADIFSGDNHSFNPAIWASVAAFFTEPTISIATSAAARKARLAAAAAVNPAFNLTADGAQFSFIESALYQSVFGDAVEGNAVTEWVNVMFREERLPYEEGWRRPSQELTIAGILGLVGKIAAASV
ncbi:Cloroperoxidase [Glarea lozoyensis ATCC 20868]|uniref:Cloroperoxidase n=1 Tax=Glarea lozoyensis (strain ATCC 20868 / MF5171) TaxID=1116229 RepID=S3D0K7_GLAL2|nr:Cloroperoxidase [Glarea lozoyensis ATCC 20868]EPE30694.1 Cloroperoxidase [Glarea lozoyensis ATCC 20868]